MAGNAVYPTEKEFARRYRLGGKTFSNHEIYLTEAEFAGRYHLGRRTVQRWRQTGDGPPWVRLGARRVLYRVSDCEIWAAARTYRHRADELARALTGAGGGG
jgi:predicted DNA-binding transcriptional regulator AlpA